MKAKFQDNQLVRIIKTYYDGDHTDPKLGDIYYICCLRGEYKENEYNEYLAGKFLNAWFGSGAILNQIGEDELEAILDEDGQIMFVKWDKK